MALNILLIEDNLGDKDFIEDILADCKSPKFTIHWKENLTSGLNFLKNITPDIILLDLSLPDAFGLDCFLKLHHQFDQISIIVLTGNDDDDLALKTLQAGAQDYLIKDYINEAMLIRVIQYSIERHRLKAKVKANEKQLRSIITQANDGIVIVDSEKKICFTNPQATNLLNLATEKTIGAIFQFPVCNGKKIQHNIVKDSGEIVILEMGSTEIEWKNKQVCLINIYDITERKNAEELQKKSDQLKTVQELSGAISHEFAQPLQILSGMFSFQADKLNTSEGLEVCNRMIQRITDLVKDLRNITQISKQSYLDGEIIDIKKAANIEQSEKTL